MKQLKIKQISLRNFKGMREADISLNPDVTKILGRNGAGKSTLADAVSYCLFGKDSKGNTQFGLKTRNDEGNEIPHLEHSVTLVIDLDGAEHKLTRSLREKWSKPRGSEQEVLTGNVIDYYIDDEKVTKTDYDKFVFSIAGDEIFRLLTIPSHFPNLPWQTQLDRLNAIVGDISNEDIAGSDPRYKALLAELKQKSMEAYLKHLSYSIRELKKKIDEMPVKLDTLNQTLPEKLAWNEIRNQLEANLDEYKRLSEQIAQAKAGGVKDAQRDTIRHRIEVWQKRIDQMQQSKRYSVRVAVDKHDTEVHNAKTLLSDAEDLMRDLSRKRMSLDNIINQCNEEIRDTKAKQDAGAEEWQRLASLRFQLPEDITICPTCGQYLPEEQAKQAIDKARKDFNSIQSVRKDELMKKAEQLIQKLKQAEALKTDSIAELKVVNANEQASALDYKEKEKAYKKIQSEPLPTVDSLLEADETYKKTLAELNDYKAQLDGTAPTNDNADFIAELTQKADALSALIQENRVRLSTQDQYKRVSDMIQDTRDQWQTLNSELTKLEQQQDIARSFSEHRDAILENRVNSLFSFTKFKLFKTQVDGQTREPFCTATLNGVEYKDLNSASKIAVGLDIINALSRYYDVAVPIICDNAEATLSIPVTIGQRVELYVADVSELTIL